MWQSGMIAALVLGAVVTGAQRPIREATLRDGAGKDVGQVRMRESSGRIIVEVRVEGLPPGVHGIHLHQTGQCDSPSFESAGGHHNPTNREHGRSNTRGPHLGDLGNIRVSPNGRGERTVTITAELARRGLLTFLGTGLALIVHENRDDEKTDPAGNTGARIGCAAIMP
ncbi:MAG TPA: superoxide dismutase family protein [Gemmatimonadales bacterium]|nr:superoxide dismutase family protein [Gemmatimonadales bacterium]